VSTREVLRNTSKDSRNNSKRERKKRTNQRGSKQLNCSNETHLRALPPDIVVKIKIV